MVSAESANDLLKSFVSRGVNRFQASEKLLCPNGMEPTLHPFVQHREISRDDFIRWKSGRASNYAPYLWIHSEDDSARLAFTSLVQAEWITCDDEGHEFLHGKDYWFHSRYSVKGDSSAADFDLEGFAQVGSQRDGNMQNHTKLLKPIDLLDGSFVYTDPVVNGPAEHSVLMTPEKFSFNLNRVDHQSFEIEFKDACGMGQPLRIKYVRSECENIHFCEEFPAEN
jgi:hypothetical protein